MQDQELEKILKPFREQGVEKVYVSECCGRTYVGREPAKRCRTCDKTPVSKEIVLNPPA